MSILGVDPGLNATGYGVIEAQGTRLVVVEAGTIRPSARQSLAQRLLSLYNALAQVIDTHRPSLTVLESLYTHHEYLTTSTLMAHARGVACLLSAQRGLTVVEYLPTRVKKALTGYGTASKEQVARMVGQWLGRSDASWSSDATDALALAIAHVHVSQHGIAQPSRKGHRRRVLAALVDGQIPRRAG